jgi:hypothetical protein
MLILISKKGLEMNPIVEKIRNRIHDAPLETERLLDDAAEEIERLEAELERLWNNYVVL